MATFHAWRMYWAEPFQVPPAPDSKASQQSVPDNGAVGGSLVFADAGGIWRECRESSALHRIHLRSFWRIETFWKIVKTKPNPNNEPPSTYGPILCGWIWQFWCSRAIPICQKWHFRGKVWLHHDFSQWSVDGRHIDSANSMSSASPRRWKSRL